MFYEKHIELIANFASYNFKTVLRRVLGISISSVLLFFLAITLTETPILDRHNTTIALIFIIVGFNTVSEGNIFLVKVLRRIKKMRSRFIPQALIVLLFTLGLIVFWINLAIRVFGTAELFFEPVTQLLLLFGIILVLIMHILIMLSYISNEWMESRKEIEDLKNAKLQNDYNSLQDRLNPHFLFNNLSILKSLIRYSPESAEVFTQNFTDVYRYLLKSHESKIVSVANELEFVDAYIALHKERLGEGLRVSIDVKEDVLVKTLPPMAIQLLVENAIKHNVVSRSKPLHIYIASKDDVLTVRNKINKKETTYSTHTGLKTLKAQYQLISNKELDIKVVDGDFIVSVPLL